jgi:uncharacterized protein (DUF2062 family)
MRKFTDTIKKQLSQGSDPKGLAMTCALGFAIGVFPILGVTTAICLLVGAVLKLNQPILQVLNYLIYPLQIILIPVFLKLGAELTGSPMITLRPESIMAEFGADAGVFLQTYGMAGLHAVLVWCLVAPLLILLIYQVALRIFSSWSKK